MKTSIASGRHLVALAAAALVTIALPHPAAAFDVVNAFWSGSRFGWGHAYGSGGGYWSRFAGASGARVVRLKTRYRPGSIVVSFADRRLYYIWRSGQAISYPIGVPMGRARWSGVSVVSRKRVNPPWTPTPQMRRENPALPAHVPGGHPRNPLGARALYLGNTLYRIHGTDAPWTIGREVSHGCIRMYNRDVVDLYGRVRVGARVVVTWRRFSAI